MSDEIVINAVPLMGELVIPAVMHICRTMPEVTITYRSEQAVADLSDCRTIGIRAGVEPDNDRLAIRWLGRIGVALVASADYIAKNGHPKFPHDLAKHDLAAGDFGANETPWINWLRANTDSQRIVFRSNDETALRQAIKSGRCAGFLPISSLIWSPDLIEIMSGQAEWAAPLWLVHDRGANQVCRSVGKELADIMARQLA